MKKSLFYFVAFFAMFLCSCSSDDDSSSDPGSANTTDVAVTGKMTEQGVTTITLNGYVNLNLLPQSVTTSEMGIEYWLADSDEKYGGYQETTNEFVEKNRISVKLSYLLPGKTYCYRTYVKSSDNIYYYGVTEKFTMDAKDVIKSYDVKTIYPYFANIEVELDTVLLKKIQNEGSSFYIGIQYSTSKADLEANNDNVITKNTLYEELQNKDNPSKFTYRFKASNSSCYYYRLYTSYDPYRGERGIMYGSIKTIDYSKAAKTEEAVDLGLSVKWASCNLGASTPYDEGSSFAWGKTEPNTSYDFSDYLSKYNPSDGKTRLEESDDAATKILGTQWRMPTATEFEELYRGCLRISVDAGVVFIGNNGNMILLPNCIYWTSDIDDSRMGSCYVDGQYVYYYPYAHIFQLRYSGESYTLSDDRKWCFCIRPVKK